MTLAGDILEPGARLAEARAAVQDGALAAATQVFRAWLADHPGDFTARLELAWCLRRQQLFAESNAELRQAGTLRPGDPRPLVVEAENLADLGARAEAVARYQDALALQPDRLDALVGLAAQLRMLGRPGEALAHYRQALAAAPANAGLLRKLAETCAEAGDHAGAEAHYGQFLSAEPDDLDAAIGLARAVAQQRRHAEAGRQLRALLPLVAEGSAHWQAISAGLRDLARAGPGAAAPAPAAATHRPALQAARALAQAGRNEAALRAFTALLARAPDMYEAAYGLGHAQRKLGRHAASLAAFEAALALRPEDFGAQLEIALALRDLGRLAEAAALYRALAERDPASYAARIGLARVLTRSRDHEEALAHYRLAGLLRPQEAEPRLAIGEQLRELGRLDLSISAYRALLEAVPDDYQALLGLARSQRRAGDHAAACASFAAAAELRPEEISPRLGQAEELQALGRIEAAEAAFRALLDRPDAAHAATIGLGLCRRQAADHTGALEYFRQAAALRPDDLTADRLIAGELRELGRLDDALAGFRALLARAPDDHRAQLGLAYTLRRGGDRQAAAAAFSAATALRPGDAEAWLGLGEELRDLGQFDAALAAHHRVLAGEPGHFRALMGLGYCLRRAGDREGALAAFRQASAARPQEAGPLLEIAVELRDAGQVAAALAQCRATLAAAPEQPRAWQLLGRLLRHAGRDAEALPALTRALELAPELPNIATDLAEAEYATGARAAALARAQEAARADPANPQPHLTLGEWARQATELDAAIVHFIAAVNAAPMQPRGYILAAQALLERGLGAKALELLDFAEGRLGEMPELAGRRISILGQSGQFPAAHAAADAAAARHPRHFQLWEECMRQELRAGTPESIAARLAAAPASGPVEARRVAVLRGSAAEHLFDIQGAIAAFTAALGGAAEHDGMCHAALARLNLRRLDVAAARAHLQRSAEAQLARNTVLGRGINPSQSLVGQVCDEYVLDADMLQRLQQAWALAGAARLTALRGLVGENPEHTPGAISLLLAMRQAGLFAPPPPGRQEGPRAIPDNIVQFWDDPAPPADVLELHQSWRTHNPGYRVTLYNDATAAAFLAEHFPPPVLAAWRACRQPAQRADLFRLAALIVQGGTYADMDDRCLAPLAELLPPTARHVFWQENFGTLGNNFLAAAPGSPILRLALRAGVEAVNRGDADILWLATGPGLLTRAFAASLPERAEDFAGWLGDVAVYSLISLARGVAAHCLTAHKRSPRHWDRALFVQRAARPAA